MDDGWVATADASWAVKGNRSSTTYHWPNEKDAALSCCGYFVLDDEYGSQPWADVPESMRCRRGACQKRYRAAAEAT